MTKEEITKEDRVIKLLKKVVKELRLIRGRLRSVIMATQLGTATLERRRRTLSYVRVLHILHGHR